MTAYDVPEIEHSEWDATTERTPLFTIGRPNPDFDQSREESEDNPRETHKVYDMPSKPHVGLGLSFLRMARLHGGEIAMTWLLEECVGTEGYLALAAEPNIEQGVVNGIMRRARDIVLGGLEAPKD